MTDKKNELTPVRHGEILDPKQETESDRRQLSAPRRRMEVSGNPFTVKAKAWAERKRLEAAKEQFDAETEALAAYEARERAFVSFERALVRSERLDELRLIEELKITEELASVVDAGKAEDGARAARAFRVRADLAQAEAEALAAEQYLDTIRNKKPPSEPQEKLSPTVQARIDIIQYQKEFTELRETLIKQWGGEGNLTEAKRRLLNNIEAQLEHKSTKRIEDL